MNFYSSVLFFGGIAGRKMVCLKEPDFIICRNMVSFAFLIVKLASMNELSYSLGVTVGTNLKQQGFEPESMEDFFQAIRDVMEDKKTAVEPARVNEVVNKFFQDLQQRRTEEKQAEQKKFFEANGKREGVITRDSGLQYEILTAGEGDQPVATDTVTVHYEGTLLSGEVFDSSVKRGEPATFPVNGVIQGWQEALPLMPVGSKWKVFIPSDLAYGAQGAGNLIGPHTPLVFEVELISIQK